MKPNLHVQVYDNDLFPGTDDFIGETLLNLLSLRPAQKRREKQGFVAELLQDAFTCCNLWPFSLWCKCCRKPEMKDLTLERVTCPALVITGSYDVGSTPAMSRKLGGDLVHSELIINTGHRHMAPSEFAPQMAAQVMDFLHRHQVRQDVR